MVRKRIVIAAGVVAVLGTTAGLSVARADENGNAPRAQHVLLISVDGMHESDLQWYVKNHPGSALAALDDNGVDFTHARTTIPSDSFPGMVAQFTGGTPQSTGIYYDDTWNAVMYPAGTTNCATATPGTEVTYFEQLDKDQSRLDAGQGIANELGGTAPNYNIMQLDSNPDHLIDPTQLPVDPQSCQPVYPHAYLQVNTIFNVAHNAGLLTAWSDKHPAYEIASGPSGNGVNDFFTPEINSDNSGPPFASGDWTSDNAATKQYDSYKVQAVLNWIDGKNHHATATPGTPAILGMNFQTVSTAEKLPKSDGMTVGYVMSGGKLVPGPLLSSALDYINAQLQTMVAHINARGLQNNTVIILSAKHGQSPMNPADLRRIPDGTIIDDLNAAWHTAHPTGVNPLVAQGTDDDGMLLWLHDRSSTATTFAKNFLWNYTNINANNTTTTGISYSHAGLSQIFAGAEAAGYFHVQAGDPRVPDIFGIAQYGVVYTGGTKKIAEHGGAHFDDLNVPLLVSGNAIGKHDKVDDTVHTTQIAPTILSLLGLDPNNLQAVQQEHTSTLNLGG
jgi:hypothetical protein